MVFISSFTFFDLNNYLRTVLAALHVIMLTIAERFHFFFEYNYISCIFKELLKRKYRRRA